MLAPPYYWPGAESGATRFRTCRGSRVEERSNVATIVFARADEVIE